MNYPKTRFSVVAAIVCVILLSACGGRDDRLYPYRWMRAGEPFDSLTLALDRKWTFRAPNDSIAGDIGRLMELAADDSTDNVKNARAHFFNARWMMRLGRYGEAQEEFQRALSLTDSASHPYDWRRIMFGLEKYDPRPGLEYYNILVKDIDFLEKVGDNGYLGIRYMDMGGLLNSLGAPERGLEMLEKADSCLALAGWDRMISDNRINKASSYFLLHREDEGKKILRDMLRDPKVLGGDRRIVMILYHNLYEFAKDTAAIRLAYDEVRDIPSQKGFQCQYESILAENFVNEGKIDSAVYYSDKAISKLPYVYAPSVRLLAYRSRASVMDAVGKVDSAYSYLSAAVALSDSIEEATHTSEILNSETLKQILEQEHRADIEQRRHVTGFLCVIFGVLVVAGIVAAVIYRRLQRQKLGRVQTQLQLEQSQRQVLAMQIAMEEKDRLFSDLSRELNDLAVEGDISHKASMKLENSMKTHLGLEAERKGFVQTFAEVSPAFQRRLKERYPALSDADVRLASYIAVGLDNKHIARILSIRPDSVKQARWRLRNKLNLSGDESLDDVIAGFMDDRQ